MIKLQNSWPTNVSCNMMFGMPPPFSCREWTQDNQLWVQYPSTAPCTRLDVLTLQEELDRRLEQLQVLWPKT